jgi:hypothetical protein
MHQDVARVPKTPAGTEAVAKAPDREPPAAPRPVPGGGRLIPRITGYRYLLVVVALILLAILLSVAGEDGGRAAALVSGT